ncbi:hypothetical protein ACFL60_05695 [Candidatus Omnitrophota bacterium]
MDLYKQFPPILLVRAFGLLLRGRVHFRKDCIGTSEKGEREDFVIFRKIVVYPAGNQLQNPGAIFKVRFHFAKFSFRINRLLSLIPVPFIIAQPGFRSKTWMTGLNTGAFQGVYEWDLVEDAEKYWYSFPLKLMKKRAVPETLTK